MEEEAEEEDWNGRRTGEKREEAQILPSDDRRPTAAARVPPQLTWRRV